MEKRYIDTELHFIRTRVIDYAIDAIIEQDEQLDEFNVSMVSRYLEACPAPYCDFADDMIVCGVVSTSIARHRK